MGILFLYFDKESSEESKLITEKGVECKCRSDEDLPDLAGEGKLVPKKQWGKHLLKGENQDFFLQKIQSGLDAGF